jgi:4-oxalocrotonate tautomerase
MPFVRIQLKEGRTKEQKEKMAKEIIETVHKHGGAKKESIRVIYEEMASENFYKGENI